MFDHNVMFYDGNSYNWDAVSLKKYVAVDT